MAAAAEGEQEEQELLLPPGKDPPEPPSSHWRDAAGFWLLGLANNLPYVLMLSAARDILEPHQGALVPPAPRNGSRFDCNPMSTGAVLLADIVPTLLLKLAAPFGLHLLPYWPRVLVSAFCAWGSFSLVVWAKGVAVSLGGVALASVASGLGELTLLALAASYPSCGLTYWSSGTGAAGLVGALAYEALRGAGLSLRHALLVGLVLPHVTLLRSVIGGATLAPEPLPSLPIGCGAGPTPSLLANPCSFFFLLTPPPSLASPTPGHTPQDEAPPTEGTAQGVQPMRGGEKWRVGKLALAHAAPLLLVYFAEYLINQGLLELLYFPKSSLTHGDQYRSYQLLYQAGVFLARSSPRCLRLRRIWLLALLQVLNAVLLLAAVLVPFLPGLAAAFVLIGWEGLVGGGAYVNTFLNVAEEVEPQGLGLAMTVAALADTVGIALAGGVAMGVHQWLCPP
ncbi:LOW QUALITY PROTEIN: battenin [Dryobates pubescens]|uniref:LOW QUALITY PROTEIN: battenin n=1 Tax=Dryobates pubescens TaxID=118200 RepID=UPI0023B8B978|nr:LOW QUALITY PROTEIN: battenin [Dryobates pubescens]